MGNKPVNSRPEKTATVPTEAEMRPAANFMGPGRGTVEDVVNAHSQKEEPNYKTTQTLLRIMEEEFSSGRVEGGFSFSAPGFRER